MQSYEVAIVGGGPAGLSTALFLADAAPALTERMVVLEKARYPRDKICGGAIGARGDRLLESIGVRVDVPSVNVSTLSLHTSFGGASARLGHIGRVVRRIEFDHALAQQVRARGIRILEDAKVTGLARSGSGVTLQSAVGEIAARVVIGADGVSGVVRKAIGLGASPYRAQVIELDTERVDGDLPRDTLSFDYFAPGFAGYAWDFPTLVDGMPLMCRGVYHLKLPGQAPADIAELLARRLSALGLDLTRYKVKRFAECGFETRQRYAVPHIALVGEAAGIDAFSGEGIPQAIEYGAFAGRYLAEKLQEGDLSFRDWGKRMLRAKPGYDLRMREWLMHHYYGSRRELIERHVGNLPEFVQCTAEQLAGLPISNLRFLRALTLMGVHAVASRVRPSAWS